MSDKKYHQTLTANRKLLAENKRLKAEVERLTKAHSDALADFWSIHKGYFDLKDEVERLRASSFVTAVPSEHYERVIKAGDAVALDYAERIEIEAGDSVKNLMRKLPVLREWNAAKEGKQP